MIDTNLIQAGIVTKLLANAALTTYLTSQQATGEIRESEYQSAEFVYPNVRVEMGTQVEEGNPPCYSTIPFTIYYNSEHDSSKQANHLAGLGNSALIRQTFSGTGFISGIIISDGSVAARRTGQRIWQAAGFYRANIYGGDF